MAQGREHPDTQAWCLRNGIDPMSIPTGPGRVCASALTSADSIRYLRPKVARYLPAEARWHGLEGAGEAWVDLPGGGRVIFKSNDQGARSYQGDSWRLCWLDEEHDADVYREARMRLLDQHGEMILTMTPLRGLTWVYDDLVATPADDVRVHWLHMSDNPYLDQEEVERVLRAYGPHERAARERGEFTALEGRVYPDWRRDIHLGEPPDIIPQDWEWYGAIDFGTANPFCYLLCVRDPGDDVLYVVDMHYRAQMLLSAHAAAIRAMEEKHGAHDIMRWADPEDRSSRMTLAAEYDIETTGANKAIRAGINAVATRLALDVAGQPHLLVSPRLSQFVREVESYVWAERRSGKADDPDVPLKRDDHCMDDLRYVCMGLANASAWRAA